MTLRVSGKAFLDKVLAEKDHLQVKFSS